MRLLQSLFICLIVLPAILWQGSAFAQTKTKGKAKAPSDTVYIFKKETDKPKPKFDPSSNMREKVIVIYPNDTLPKPKPRAVDTVIILKKGLTKAELAEKEKQKVIQVLKNNNYCTCVKMDIKVDPTLQNETYLNYAFIFKNDCKIDAWVSSRHFRFTPYNSFDKPVKVLRKLSFVKRFDYPDFVKIAPGETFTFSYSDDAFFEYELDKGRSYKFVFEHRNFGDRNKKAPEKTYLCGQKRTQLITIK